jgi:hypothetical protein
MAGGKKEKTEYEELKKKTLHHQLIIAFAKISKKAALLYKYKVT